MAENALRWIFCAARPLTPVELIAAISITPGERIDDLASHGLTAQAILDICQPLLVLDSDLDVLRFAHFSVQEFLLGQYSRAESHTRVAEACLTLLVNPDPRPASDDRPKAYGMLDYATFNWAAHVRLPGAGSNTLTQLWKVFLTPNSAYQSWISNVSSKVNPLKPPPGSTLAPLLVTLLSTGEYLRDSAPCRNQSERHQPRRPNLITYHCSRWGHGYSATFARKRGGGGECP